MVDIVSSGVGIVVRVSIEVDNWIVGVVVSVGGSVWVMGSNTILLEVVGSIDITVVRKLCVLLLISLWWSWWVSLVVDLFVVLTEVLWWVWVGVVVWGIWTSMHVLVTGSPASVVVSTIWSETLVVPWSTVAGESWVSISWESWLSISELAVSTVVVVSPWGALVVEVLTESVVSEFELVVLLTWVNLVVSWLSLDWNNVSWVPDVSVSVSVGVWLHLEDEVSIKDVGLGGTEGGGVGIEGGVVRLVPSV